MPLSWRAKQESHITSAIVISGPEREFVLTMHPAGTKNKSAAAAIWNCFRCGAVLVGDGFKNTRLFLLSCSDDDPTLSPSFKAYPRGHGLNSTKKGGGGRGWHRTNQP
jgi:hypothetical protein